MSKSFKTLDIGIGRFPWIFREPGEGRFITEWPQEIDENTEYIGVDCHQNISQLRRELDRGRWKELIKGELRLMVADATKLPFRDGFFSAVILSDIFSIPTYDWCACEPGCTCNCPKCIDCDAWYCDGCEKLEEVDYDREKVDCSGCEDYPKEDLCCGTIYRGVSDEQKLEIAKEALRVLARGGTLIVANYSTPSNALPIFYEFFNGLVGNGKLAPKEVIDRTYISEIAGDLRGFVEAHYQKSAKAIRTHDG